MENIGIDAERLKENRRWTYVYENNPKITLKDLTTNSDLLAGGVNQYLNFENKTDLKQKIIRRWKLIPNVN